MCYVSLCVCHDLFLMYCITPFTKIKEIIVTISLWCFSMFLSTVLYPLTEAALYKCRCMCQNADRDICLSVSPSIHLCMSVSLFTSPCVCLPLYISVGMSPSLHLCMSPCIHLCMSDSFYTSLHVCLPLYISACLSPSLRLCRSVSKKRHTDVSQALVPRYAYMHLTHLTLGRPQRPRRQDAQTKAWRRDRLTSST